MERGFWGKAAKLALLVTIISGLLAMLSSLRELGWIHAGWTVTKPPSLHDTLLERVARSGFEVELRTIGRGGEVPIGQPLVLSIRSPRAGRLSLVALEPSGAFTVLLPNRWLPEGLTLAAGEAVRFPGAREGFALRSMPPEGRETLFALVGPRPLDLEGVLGSLDHAPFWTLPRRRLETLGALLQAAIAPEPGEDSLWGAARLDVQVSR